MYSQFGEDDKLIELFEGKTDGRVLDIGAWHPTDKSNSRALIERGWSAVLIEPSPGPMLNIVRACFRCGHVPAELYGERKAMLCPSCGSGVAYGYADRITLISAAVAIEPGLVQIMITDDAVSTGDQQSYATWQQVGGFYGALHVPAITLEQLSNQYGGFDVVSFDAEGISVDLAIRYMEIGCRPRAMIIEHDGRLVELLPTTEAAGYKAVLTNGTNVIVERNGK